MAEPTTRPRQKVNPMFLRREAAALFCGVAESTWDRLTAAGLTPAPVKVGGAVGWSRRQLAAWIDHGCPPRAEWSAVWAAIVARRSGQPARHTP